jgi:hypothetical protein
MKTFSDAQEWIVKTSLITSACLIVFFFIAPGLLNFPVEVQDAHHLLQLVLPPFFGYLALAVRSIVSDAKPKGEWGEQRVPRLLPLLIKGTNTLYLIIIVTALITFYLANAPSLGPKRLGTPVHFEDLSWAICAALSLQAATFGVLTAFVFRQDYAPVAIGDTSENKE